MSMKDGKKVERGKKDINEGRRRKEGEGRKEVEKGSKDINEGRKGGRRKKEGHQ